MFAIVMEYLFSSTMTIESLLSTAVGASICGILESA